MIVRQEEECPLSAAELAEWDRLRALNPRESNTSKKRQRTLDPSAYREIARAQGMAMAAFLKELAPEKRAYVKKEVRRVKYARGE